MKLNGIVRLVIYTGLTLCMSAFYDSWSSTTTLLVRFGVYRDVCVEPLEVPASPDIPLCDEQLQKISGLLSIFRISEFVTSIGVGVLMDVLGTKACMLLGISMRILSWLLLVYLPHYNWIMILACVICGISVNSIIFPVFTIARYLPRYQDMSMCVISASLSAGTYYVPIINGILSLMSNVDMPAFVWVKLLFTHMPWLVVTLFVFPHNLAKDVELNLKDSEYNVETDKNDDVKDMSSWNVQSLIRYILNMEVLIITLVFILNCVSFTFVQEAYTQVYANNKTAEHFNGIMVPSSFVFSLLFMWVVNRYGVVIVMLGLNIISMLSHVFMLSSSTVCGIFTSICISLAFSGFLTYYYILLEHIVDILYSGSIKGYLTTVGGLSLALNPLINFLVARYDTMSACNTVFVVIRACMILPILWLLKRETDRRKHMHAVKAEMHPSACTSRLDSSHSCHGGATCGCHAEVVHCHHGSHTAPADAACSTDDAHHVHTEPKATCNAECITISQGAMATEPVTEVTVDRMEKVGSNSADDKAIDIPGESQESDSKSPTDAPKELEV
ncbi:Major Facilitator Superfamily protein [Babesia bovis T2Bo]|uniref:Major facilitator superfamily (MFS) profile domain-containing protein n=1 Tax=Babesia bovis TaxID=5865 RepID=A7AUN9_BABBO|nr:Major Facilitator Superfamily protein [Babesia bovis T2Bo]EDO06650.1 Major Facilitator Superfamily protein [Babesia bovis T2Bo]|eukprot:XP_001610218.1 hypothetical protein [Babesia bovis T2Bo]